MEAIICPTSSWKKINTAWVQTVQVQRLQALYTNRNLWDFVEIYLSVNAIRQNITAPCCFSNCKIDLVWAGGPGGNPSHVITVALPCFSSLDLSSLQFTKIIFLCWRQASAIKIASKIPVVIPSLDDPFNSVSLILTCMLQYLFPV